MASPFDFIAQSIAAHNGSATQTSSAPTSPSSPRTSPLEDYYNEQMQQKQPNPPIKNEADNGLLNTRGTIAMARTADKDSATSQFFINVADNAFLDHGQRDFGYAVFGKVVKGMDVADKISQVQTHDVGPYQNVPSKPVVILSAKVLP